MLLVCEVMADGLVLDHSNKRMIHLHCTTILFGLRILLQSLPHTEELLPQLDPQSFAESACQSWVVSNSSTVVEVFGPVFAHN